MAIWIKVRERGSKVEFAEKILILEKLYGLFGSLEREESRGE